MPEKWREAAILEIMQVRRIDEHTDVQYGANGLSRVIIPCLQVRLSSGLMGRAVPQIQQTKPRRKLLAMPESGMRSLRILENSLEQAESLGPMAMWALDLPGRACSSYPSLSQRTQGIMPCEKLVLNRQGLHIFFTLIHSTDGT